GQNCPPAGDHFQEGFCIKFEPNEFRAGILIIFRQTVGSIRPSLRATCHLGFLHPYSCRSGATVHLRCACRETILGLSKLIELPSEARILRPSVRELTQSKTANP